VPTYRDIFDQFSALVRDYEPVTGAAAIGSFVTGASGETGPGDLDLLVFASQPEELLTDSRWLSPLGRIWAATVDRSLPALPVKRLLLDDAAQLDLFIVSPDAPSQLPALPRAVLADIARRGFEPLKDGGPVPAGLAALAEEAGGALRARPSQDQFSSLVAQFWIDAVRVARRLGRGEIWAAKRIVDGPMKDALVQLRAWTIKALKGPDYETYWRGRRLEEWASKRFLNDFAEAFEIGRAHV
jgi:aminoglycoside 6-adenylyltransferase